MKTTETIMHHVFTLGDHTIFVAKRKDFLDHTIRVHLSPSNDMSFYVDCDTSNLEAMIVGVLDCTEMCEEEFFQYSLLWEHAIPIELVRKVQKMGIERLGNIVYEQYTTKVQY